MSEQRDLLEKLAVYRELSAEEREALRAKLAADPAAAGLLESYRDMDRKLAALPDPEPDPALGAAFRRALAAEAVEAPARRPSFAWLKRAPAAAGQLAALALLLLLVAAAGLLFRDRSRLAEGGPALTTVAEAGAPRWQLLEIDGDPVATRLLGLDLGKGDGRRDGAAFEARGYCAVFTGAVDLEAARIFDVNRRDLAEPCAPDFAGRDGALEQALRAAAALRHEGERLAVVDDAGSVRLLYGPPRPLIDPALNGSAWALTSLQGEAPLPGVEVTLEIGPEPYLGGWTGCNEYTGQIHQLADGELHLGYFIVTEVGCPSPAGLPEQEALFTTLFQEAAAGYRVAGDELALLDGAGEPLMGFRRVAVADANPTATPTPAGPLPGPTPTPAVAVDADAPFAPFRNYMQRWPAESGMAHGALRAGMTAYLARLDTIGTLAADPALMADLESRLRPAVPGWGAHTLQLADAYPGGGPELVVAALPYVDVYSQDSDGTILVRGLRIPRYWPAGDSYPVAVTIGDLDGDRFAEIAVTFAGGGVDGDATELLLARFDPARGHWTASWRAAVTGVGALPPGEAPFVLNLDTGAATAAVTCPAVGPFDLPGYDGPRLARTTTSRWDGVTFSPFTTVRATPATARQRANLAEAALRAGDLVGALARYRALAAADSPATPGEPAWQTLAALRAGQIHALRGEQAAAEEMLGQARLSGTPLGRAAGIFAEAYAEDGDVTPAWSALLGAADLHRALQADSQIAPLALAYPGMGLASALGDLTPADLDEQALPDLLGRWQAAGLSVGAGRLADLDGDGELEIVAAQAVPNREAAAYVPLSVLDHGAQGWHAVTLGELPSAEMPLPALVPAPDGPYLLLPVGGFYAGWDGQQAAFFQPPDPAYPLWLRSTRPGHLCPLPAAEETTHAWRPAPAPSPTPTRFPPTMTAPDAATPTPYSPPPAYPGPSPTPTAWDREGFATPTRYPGTLSPPTRTPDGS